MMIDDEFLFENILNTFFQIRTEHYKALVASPQTDHYCY